MSIIIYLLEGQRGRTGLQVTQIMGHINQHCQAWPRAKTLWLVLCHDKAKLTVVGLEIPTKKKITNGFEHIHFHSLPFEDKFKCSSYTFQEKPQNTLTSWLNIVIIMVKWWLHKYLVFHIISGIVLLFVLVLVSGIDL